MPRRGLVKCFGLFLLLICPNLIRSMVHNSQLQNYYRKRTSNDVIDANVKLKPHDWSTNIIRNYEDNEITDIDQEPGFDLSDEEIKKFKLWPKGIVPYYIDAVSFNDKVLRDRIRLFLNTVNSLTRLSFLEMPCPPKDDTTRWVFFVNRRGQLDCSDHSILNFTNEGVQRVNLGYDCLSTGRELAEAVLSVVGLPPQHNSPDRDEYINVLEENIMPEKRYLFHKLNNDQWLFHSMKYDFFSAGHYHHHRYSANGRATIEFKNSDNADTQMGDNNRFTRSDIRKLWMLYNYIVKKKENKIPECEKLFRKGRNFAQNQEGYLDPKPRRKPNKYLGLSEEKPTSVEDDDEEDKTTRTTTWTEGPVE